MIRPLVLAVCAALPATTGAQVPTDWTIELVCRSSLDAGIAPFRLPFPSSLSSQYVSLDEDGSIAIRTVLNTAAASEGIFVGSPAGGGIVLSANSPGNPIWSVYIGHRNNMFAASGPGVNGANVYDETGTLLQSFPNGGNEGTANPGFLSLTSTGAICSRSGFGSNDKVIIDEFIAGTRTQTLIADDFSGDYQFLFAPKINDAQQVLFNSIPTSGPARAIVRREPGGAMTTIAQTTPLWDSFVNSTDLSQAGHVAFTARRVSDGLREINIATDNTHTRIAQPGDLGILSSDLASFPPVVNSNALVAFRAKDESQTTALFVGDGSSLVRIVGLGDLADTDLGPIPFGYDFGGITGIQLLNGIIDINDNNQIAFAAFLQNGTIGVFLATPNAPCLPDVNGDGKITPTDFTAWINAFNNNLPECDQNSDGSCTPTDFTAWIVNFNAGC